MKNHKSSPHLAIGVLSFLSVTGLIATAADAQTRLTDSQSNITRASALKPRFKLLLAPIDLKAASSTDIRANDGASSNLTLIPTSSGANVPVLGSGMPGRLTKWIGVTSSNSVIGDSMIFEDKNGNVGIGTDSPTSKLTVAGTILASGGSSVLRDSSLTGNGTTASPLGVAVPLFLRGAVSSSAIIPAVVEVVNTQQGGTAVIGFGGSLTTGQGADNGGVGVQGIGGSGLSTGDVGGVGVSAIGGNSGGTGGAGMQAIGGGAAGSLTSAAGPGVRAQGGTSTSGAGAPGVIATGGFGATVTGTGVIGRGGDSETGVGGDGIQGFAGKGHAPGFEGAAGTFFGDVVVVEDLGVQGDVSVTGNLTVFGVKHFKIDHPLDPENKYLYHAAIESSEVLNVYSGNVVTNASGEAAVTLPEWFEAINRDFRYQLTVVGAFAQAVIAGEVLNNRFTIRTNAPSVKVSWQVTGVRSDAVMRKHPFKAVEDKPERERGTYLRPEAFDQPEEKNVLFVRHPQVLQQLKESREKTQRTREN